MSDTTERRSPFSQPMYIVWMLLFVIGFFILEVAVMVGLGCAIYGVPTLDQFTTVRNPVYSRAALWKDRIWYPIQKIGPGRRMSEATLTSSDPEKGAVADSSITIPFPTMGLVAQGDSLWAISLGVVTRIDGEVSTEYKTNRMLNRPCPPFLYEGKLAVIDMGKVGSPTLLIFENEDWIDLGTVLIPSDFAKVTGADGKPSLVASTTKVRTTLLELRIVTQGERSHLFISDGLVVAYREGLELAPVSALVPVNVSNPVDLSDIADWQIACEIPPKRGLPVKTTWMAGLVSGEPVIFTNSSVASNPFQSVSLMAYGQDGKTWSKIAETSSPAMLDMVAVCDDQKAYVAVHSIVQTLRLFKFAGKEFLPTGVLLKAPASEFQPMMEKWGKLYPWVYWTALILFGIGASRLIDRYCGPQYQFGLTEVELASFSRRMFARLIDYSVYAIPSYFIAVACGLSNQEQIERNMDKFFEITSEGLMLRLIQLFLILMVLGLAVIIMNSVLQGRWGLTLGKWACGIRTVRTTLRPCGFARAFLRELFLAVDALMGASMLPAMLVIAFTPCRQRLGDLVADTIVIRKPGKLSVAPIRESSTRND